MGQAIWIFAVVLGLAVALLLAAILLVESEWAEARIEHELAGRLHRTVELEDIEVKVQWPPKVTLAQVRIGNPPWADGKHLVDARALALTLRFWPLLAGRVVVDRLSAARLTADLERDAGRATWRLGDSQSGGESPVSLKAAHIENGLIHYRDDSRRTALDLRIQGTAGAAGGLALQVDGQYRGEKATAKAELPFLPFSTDEAVQFTAQAEIGGTESTAHGTVRSNIVDGEFTLAGADLAALHGVLPIDLPRSPPYDIAGRVHYAPAAVVFENLSGRVGESDLAGRVAVNTAGERTFVRAEVKSTRLDLDDLGPLLGAPPATGKGESASREQKRLAEQRRQQDRALPSESLEGEAWSGVDVDATYEAEQVVNARGVDSLRFHAVLDDGRLRLEPLALGVGGGTVEGAATLDSKEDPLHARISLQAHAVQLANLFPKGKALGILQGRATLEGEGDSVATLLATSDGAVSLAVEGGSLDALLVEAAGLDLGEALALLGTDEAEQVPLNCAVADFGVKDGQATARTFVIDTRDTVLKVSGTLDLADETLDLVVRPQPRDASLLAARTPIKVGGKFRDPQVSLKGGKLAARAGAALVLGAINPLLALLPFVETGSDSPSRCAELLHRLGAK